MEFYFRPKVLIYNAELSEDHFEMHLPVDHIRPFLLIKLLAAKTASYTSRVVFVSGIAQAGFDLAIVTADPDTTYMTHMHKPRPRKSPPRARGRITAYSLHPGTVFTNARAAGSSISSLQV
ncbi:hypothetical protein C8R45DRAFT_1088944 [Mycena sanguinolenta]|nr:hypothetical protein C8R45DRAFT_1088944 [Mycena sanguinolenta]